MHWIGVDIGGTFTDLVLLFADGRLATTKVLTTRNNPSLAVRTGLIELIREHAIAPAAIANIVHATTLVTNAIIERKGAKTGLLMTEGFRDVLEIGREKRFDLYDLFIELPTPLVPRRLRNEIRERLADDGSVVVPLDEKQAREAVNILASEGIESLAVCFLHAFRNRQHEETMRRIAQDVDLEFISLSSEVAPEIREYERASTTVANAYVQPLTKRYLAGLRDNLAGLGYHHDLFVMLSSGGIATSVEAERFPIRLLESGPAAGAVAAAFHGGLAQAEPILSFDMGGTTAKLCLIEGGKPLIAPEFEAGRIYRFKKGSGIPIRVPAVEMIEIGAGGGSIAHIDSLGLLKVGPESAGADPGPACYGRGGSAPTVTDADLLLGYLDPEYFLGGRMVLDPSSATAALTALAEALNVDAVEAAWGVHRVVNASMANAARVYAAEKGRDLRRYTMVAFGGASPTHACAVAEELGCVRVVVPFGAGVSSAFGLLVTQPAIERVRAYMGRLKTLDWNHIRAIYADMEGEGRSLLRQMGIEEAEIIVSRSADMRYAGQRHQISVPLPESTVERGDIAGIADAFRQEYERLYQRANAKYELEALSWKASISGPARLVRLEEHPAGHEPQTALRGTRQLYLGALREWTACSVYNRYHLAAGVSLVGPAIIEEKECSTAVASGWQALITKHRDIVMTRLESPYDAV